MSRRREPAVFGLSFLDAMTCGLGAVILMYMIINAAAGLHADRLTADLRAEASRLDREVLDAWKNQVEVRNAVREEDDELATTRGLARRLLAELDQIEAELATFSESTLARDESIEKLKSDLLTLESETRRLSALAPAEEPPGDRVRSFVGDGDRQYLTGLKVGGERIVVLLDKSASMLDQTLVNVIRSRNMSEEARRGAAKWRQAVRTVDWLTTQLPPQARFQIYAFDVAAAPVIPGTEGQWLDAGSREQLDEAVARVGQLVPAGGTSLYRAYTALLQLAPPPDNVILLTDGLPTQGRDVRDSGKVTGKDRVRLFNESLMALPRGTPVNVILFPMEGDPLAASAFWKLALASGGSFMSPAGDWP